MMPLLAYCQPNQQPNYTEFVIHNDDYATDITFRMIDVEGGSFKMGIATDDPYESAAPQHDVTLSDFAIGEFEVTQELWVYVMEYELTSNSGLAWIETGSGYGFGYPAYYVSYDEALKFIQALNDKLHAEGQLHAKDFFRLPTEAEWEFAARGGNLSQGYAYAGSNNIAEVAVWKQVLEYNLVGQLKPNELGLYDMSGNVREWCSDYWKNSYEGAGSIDPQGPTLNEVASRPGMIQRVQRGGDKDSRYAELCRVDNRSSFRPDMGMITSGMRLALQRHKPEIKLFNVNALAENGTVEGIGEYEENAEATLTAIPNEGYRFLAWSDSITENPRIVTVTSDTTLTALFAAIEASAVETTQSETPCLLQNPVKETLRLDNLTIGTPIRIYAPNGRLVYQRTASDSHTEINTQHWNKGNYLLNIGKFSTAFIVE